MTEIRNSHPSPTPKHSNHPSSTPAREVRRFTIHLGMDRPKVDVHEGVCFVIWNVVSFVGVETQGYSAIEVFGGGVEDDSGRGSLLGEGSDKYNQGWVSMNRRAERRKESPGQEQREESWPRFGSLVLPPSTRQIYGKGAVQSVQNTSVQDQVSRPFRTDCGRFNIIHEDRHVQPLKPLRNPLKVNPVLLASSIKYLRSEPFPSSKTCCSRSPR